MDKPKSFDVMARCLQLQQREEFEILKKPDGRALEKETGSRSAPFTVRISAREQGMLTRYYARVHGAEYEAAEALFNEQASSSEECLDV